MQPALADRDKPRKALRDLDAREALLARLRIANDDAEAQREAGDVGERLARADRQRRQHRVDLVREDQLELGALLVGRVVDGADQDSLGGERRAQDGAPEPRLLGG